jgi:hypothetical protein
MRHGSPRLDRVRGRFRNRPSEGKHDTAEASIRPGSGVIAGRCVLYPPHSTLLLLPDGIVFTELVNSPIVGKSSLARLGKVCPLSPHNEELDQLLDTESVAQHTSFFATLPDPDGLLLFFAHSPRAGERILWHPLADINEA